MAELNEQDWRELMKAAETNNVETFENLKKKDPPHVSGSGFLRLIKTPSTTGTDALTCAYYYGSMAVAGAIENCIVHAYDEQTRNEFQEYVASARNKAKLLQNSDILRTLKSIAQTLNQPVVREMVRTEVADMLKEAKKSKEKSKT